MKIISHRISITKNVIPKTCLPTRQNGVENHDKAFLSLKDVSFSRC